MVNAYWGFRETPFAPGLPCQAFYPSVTHEEALARLEWLADSRRGLGLLSGPAGSGKSLVLDLLSRQLRRGGRQVAHLSLWGLDAWEFLSRVGEQLGAVTAAGAGASELWQALGRRLSENRWTGRGSLLLLDDADEAGHDVVDALSRLARCELTGSAGWTMVLAGRPERLPRLGERVLELATLRIDVEPWTLAETEGYVQFILQHAGRDERAFSNGAIARLHELSGGSVRRLQLLASLALLAAAGSRLPLVDPATLDAVHRELEVTPEPRLEEIVLPLHA